MTCTSINKKLTTGIFRFLFCVVIAALIRIIVPSLLVGSLKSFTLTNPEEPLGTNPAPCTLCDGASSSTTTEQRRRHLCLEHVNPPTIPQFVGNWERLVDFPLSLGEAHGGIIGGKELVVTGGFINFTYVNRKTYVIDLRANLTRGKTNVTWQRMDDYPYTLGVTHAAETFYGNYMYICGGYYGYPGPVQKDCFQFDRTAPPDFQYTRLPDLPEPRAGAGLTYDALRNALIYVGGTRRNVTEDKITLYDTNTTFILYLNDTASGWTRNASPKPYAGNHISFVTVNDTCSVTKYGIQRQYFFGGQQGQNESRGNLNYMYEYIISNDTWIPRQFMPYGRGHVGTSSMPFGCGFVVAGGAINVVSGNGLLTTDDISYYSSYNDTWISIGKLYNKIKTPVCGIHYSPPPVGKYYLYCTTGYRFYTYRREIQLV